MSDAPREPEIHSHITDVLPDDHPLAYAVVDCADCGNMVHASNNECMRTWVETGRGAFCVECFVRRLAADDYVLDDDWAPHARTTES